MDRLENTQIHEEPPVPSPHHLIKCLDCEGSGLVPSATQRVPDTENYPHVAIIGGGIGGVALAVACLHRGIPFTLYERDSGFNDRSQGYGLTLQQASNAIKGLGIVSLEDGLVSTRHVVHATDGKIIAEWGIRLMDSSKTKKTPNRVNVHIARQTLRLALLEQLSGHDVVQWGHQLVDLKKGVGNGVDLNFNVGDDIKSVKADLVVGADGVRSTVRNLLIGEGLSPLRYLGCITILGICPIANIKGVEGMEEAKCSLLDGATVFQTANGNERIYVMPYSSDTVMWQLSFPLSEKEAKVLSAQGAYALKQEALRRCEWHDPVPQILTGTPESLVSGYPVYDRALLQPELLVQAGQITLIGDAAHPMSPFKGQGANQALLDALALARGITKGCVPLSEWRDTGVRDSVLTEFEWGMMERSAIKVKRSAEAAEFLHSDVALYEGNEPRGRSLRREENEKNQK
ncbi:MAG: FAD-dependent monooxygenase [Fibrobacterales bacterium]